MNRPIEFRAWDKENKTMLYFGNPIIQKFDYEDGVVVSFAVDGYAGFYSHECYPERKLAIELMQFTGLYDKNGKKVFEGDIVKTNTAPNNYVVCWREEVAGFEFLEFPNHAGRDSWMPNQDSVAYRWEVIGNVWETPELLSNTKQRG